MSRLLDTDIHVMRVAQQIKDMMNIHDTLKEIARGGTLQVNGPTRTICMEVIQALMAEGKTVVKGVVNKEGR